MKHLIYAIVSVALVLAFPNSAFHVGRDLSAFRCQRSVSVSDRTCTHLATRITSSRDSRQRDLSLFLSDSTDDNDEGLGLQRDKEFWTKQKELIAEMQDKSSRGLRDEQKEKFAQRRLGLVSDTAYFGFFIFCSKLLVVWALIYLSFCLCACLLEIHHCMCS